MQPAAGSPHPKGAGTEALSILPPSRATVGFYSDDTVTSRAKQELQRRQQQPPRCAETKPEALRSFRRSDRTPQRSESHAWGLSPPGSNLGTQCHLVAWHPASQSLCTSASTNIPTATQEQPRNPTLGEDGWQKPYIATNHYFPPK